MCLYHTYHWSCCPGTAQPVPYYMNSKCEVASTSKKSRFKKQRKCRIVHRILDGADHDRPCPKCGQLASDPVDEPTADAAIDTRGAIEQDSATPKPSSTKDSVQMQGAGVDYGLDPKYEELASAIKRLIKQQAAWAATNPS